MRLGEQRDDVVGVTAAMCEPTGLGEFSRRFPDRFFDVGIAEQHAVTSAAGLASGGLHPVVAIYATFLNRAFDQVLLDVALHRLPVTFVLDRAGITGEDGPSHNGVWDLAVLGVVPGIRIAAPRDEAALREQLHEAVGISDGPSVVRFPKTPIGPAIPTVRREGSVDVLAEPGADECTDVLVVVVGALAGEVLEACESARHAGYTVRVVDPRWVTPLDPALADLARRSRAGRERGGRQRPRRCRHPPLATARRPRRGDAGAQHRRAAGVSGARLGRGRARVGRADRSGHRQAHRRVVCARCTG